VTATVKVLTGLGGLGRWAFARVPASGRDGLTFCRSDCREDYSPRARLAEFPASGKIRQGVFKGLRLDKTAEELKAEGAFG
jgi:hypothetical protein